MKELEERVGIGSENQEAAFILAHTDKIRSRTSTITGGTIASIYDTLDLESIESG